MRIQPVQQTWEESVKLLLEKAKKPPIYLREIVEILSGRGRTLILILLCLPFCQPIQIPGFSTPFGLVIAFVGIRMVFGKHAWLPQKLLSKEIAPTTLKKMASSMLWMIKKARRWIHPRLEWMCHHTVMEKINGIMIAALGLFLALPLPIPLSNLVAAWSILLIGLGILEDDGLFVILGYVMAIMSLLVFLFIIFEIGFLLK